LACSLFVSRFPSTHKKRYAEFERRHTMSLPGERQKVECFLNPRHFPVTSNVRLPANLPAEVIWVPKESAAATTATFASRGSGTGGHGGDGGTGGNGGDDHHDQGNDDDDDADDGGEVAVLNAQTAAAGTFVSTADCVCVRVCTCVRMRAHVRACACVCTRACRCG
jgi:hypothetical protein